MGFCAEQDADHANRNQTLMQRCLATCQLINEDHGAHLQCKCKRLRFTGIKLLPKPLHLINVDRRTHAHHRQL